jgi:hypothetical protein
MTSMQEYHEVLARAVIEKGTFQPWPESVRGTVGATDYRGIIDMAYGQSSGVYQELRDGIRTNSSLAFEVFDDDGSRSYINTGASPIMGNYITSLLSGDAFDFLFVAATVGAETASMIPDYQSASASSVSCVRFNSDSANNGAFYSDCGYQPSGGSSILTARLSRLPS